MNTMETTKLFHRILVATNGSEQASAAVERGVELALSEQAELVFLHVLPPTVWRTSRLAPASAIPRRLPAPLHDEALRAAAARASEMGVKARLELLSGETAREIVSVAEQLEVDLVIVGQSGRNPLRERVAPKVLHRAKCTVLVAKSLEPGAERSVPLRKAA